MRRAWVARDTPVGRGMLASGAMLIRFEPSGHEVEVEPPVAIVDVTDAHPAARIPYSCRDANCGTCRVYVVEGGEALSKPEAPELEVLEDYDDDPADVRLCCQARIVGDTERLVLRVVD